MKVNMSEVKVAALGKEDHLVTYGISTCIAIMLCGTYNKTPFVLMDHWDAEITGKKRNFMRYKICSYVEQIRDSIIDDFDPDIHEDIPIHIAKVVVIGGEKQQLDAEGNLELSGTESSVTFLKKNLIAAIKRDCEFTMDATQSWQNFLTSGSQAINVKIDIYGRVSHTFNTIFSDGVEDIAFSPPL